MGQRIPNAYATAPANFMGPPEPYMNRAEPSYMVGQKAGVFRSGGDTYTKSPEDWAKEIEGWNKLKAGLGASKTLAGKAPPKSKLPKKADGSHEAPPKNPEEVLEQAAIANTPDDDQAMKDLGRLIDKYESGKDKKLDLSPLLALTDSWTGSNLLRAYDAPMGDEEREKTVLGLKAKFAEQKENLAYKREYMQSQKDLQKEAATARQEDKNADRALRLQLANMTGQRQAAKAESTAANKDMSNKSTYLKQNKNAVSAIARKRYGTGDPDDKSHMLRVGPINDEIYDFGKQLENDGLAKKGMGYNTALEFYLSNASGPDGAK